MQKILALFILVVTFLEGTAQSPENVSRLDPDSVPSNQTVHHPPGWIPYINWSTEELRRLFESLDSDGDHEIDAFEASKELGKRALMMNAEDIWTQQFLPTDAVQPRAIMLKALLIFYAVVALLIKAETLRVQFEEFDANRDGFITVGEMQQGMKKRGDSGGIGFWYTMLAVADTHVPDGRLDWDEYQKLGP
ncbi:unnamed protein product, partial [Mesorhabditis spiculigera]